MSPIFGADMNFQELSKEGLKTTVGSRSLFLNFLFFSMCDVSLCGTTVVPVFYGRRREL